MKRDSSPLGYRHHHHHHHHHNTLPVDVWQSIVLHCDIEVALAPISIQWSDIARANINALLRNWIQREASKPESDGTPIDKSLHILYRETVQMHYRSRRACADFSAMTPCMDFYRAVVRLYKLERTQYSRYRARWVPRSTLLGNIMIIDYDANAAKYNIVPLKYYKHLLRLKDNGRHYYYCVEFGPNEFTPTSYVSVIGQKTNFDYTSTSLLSIELKHDAPIEIGDDYVAENPVDFDEKIKQQDAHLVYVADGWTMDDIKEYLTQRFRYLEQYREAIAVMNVLEKQYLEKSRADWLDRCRARAAVIRAGFADWNSHETSRLIGDSLFHAETRPIAELLCQLNERGFYTIDSQPTKNQSADAVHRHQRSYIAGYMPCSEIVPLYQTLGMSPNDNSYGIAVVVDGSIIISYDVSAEADGIPIGRVMLPESSELSGVARALGVRQVHFIDMDWRRQQPHLFTTLIELMNRAIAEPDLF